jgi:hypothetical protein
MQAIGYIRVSTDQQAERGISLDAQRARVRAMATVQSAELLDVIVDGGESAKSMNRPELQLVLSLVNAGKVQAVIIAKLDRLTRSTCAFTVSDRSVRVRHTRIVIVDGRSNGPFYDPTKRGAASVRLSFPRAMLPPSQLQASPSAKHSQEGLLAGAAPVPGFLSIATVDPPAARTFPQN